MWQQEREKIVQELLQLGYKCLIKTINRSILPMELLGTVLDESAVSVMKAKGIDVCGENGEYHTLAVDGPAFQEPLLFHVGGKILLGDYAVSEITAF